MLKLITIFGLVIAGTNTLIVPGELPTILSLVYSNIPTIKKGTDSRLGWGFRLGNRAEIQVLVELGPQTNTRPLGVQPDSDANSRKRNTADTLADTLYAQRQRFKNNYSNTDGGKWMKEWSQYINSGKIRQNRPKVPQKPQVEVIKEPEEENTVLGIGEIDAKSVIPDDSEEEMRNRLSKTTTEAVVTTTSKEDALDNVAIDD